MALAKFDVLEKPAPAPDCRLTPKALPNWWGFFVEKMVILISVDVSDSGNDSGWYCFLDEPQHKHINLRLL